MSFSHSDNHLKVNNRKISGKSLNIWKLRDTPSSPWKKAGEGGRNVGRNRKSFEFNENETGNHLFRLIRKKKHAQITDIRNEIGDITILKE